MCAACDRSIKPCSFLVLGGSRPPAGARRVQELFERSWRLVIARRAHEWLVNVSRCCHFPFRKRFQTAACALGAVVRLKAPAVCDR